MSQRILVVDDDPTVNEVVRRYLEQAGFAVTTAGNGLNAVELALGDPPDLVVSLRPDGAAGEDVVIPLPDALLVLAIAAGCSLLVTGAGVLMLRAVRRRSLTLSLAVLVAVAHATLIVSALATAGAMFLSGHDLAVLLGVVVVAGPAGLAVALLLGRALVRSSAALGAAVSGLGQELYEGPDRLLGAELTELDRHLAAADARLQECLRRERALEAGRRELVSWMSHDLRTPLAGLRVLSDALLDGVVEDRVTLERYVRGISRETERLTGMVEDLFQMSSINASVPLVLQPVAVAEVLSDAAASARPVAVASGVRLTAVAPDAALVVQASLPELGRVLRNVPANAIRHTPAAGTVALRAERAGDDVVLEVADACGGIPLGDLPRLFEVAFRGSAARTPGDVGAGLGLAIARGLVEAHGGTGAGGRPELPRDHQS